MVRKAKGEGTLRKRVKIVNGKQYNYWEGQITIGVNPGTGKQQRRTFTGKRQKEVREKMQAAAVAVNENDFFEPRKVTVKQWFETWLKEYSSDKKPLTIQKYESMAKTHIYPAIGAVQLAKLTAPQVQKFYNGLSKTGKTVTKKDRKTGKVTTSIEPLSAKTIRDIHGIMSKCLNVAIDQGIIKTNVAERVTVPKVIKQEVQPLTEEQQKLFLQAIHEHRYGLIYSVILFTGLRESEAVGLTWDCIDFQKGTLKVYRQLQRTPKDWNNYIFMPLKNSKTRTVKLSPFVLSLFQEQKIKQIKERFAANELWEGFQNEEERKTGLVFTTAMGKNIDVPSMYKEFKKIVSTIGAPAARIHDLRHTFAVISLQNGDDLKTVQNALGHATAAFTLDVYGHVSDRMKEESARRQQEYIKSLIG